MGLGDTGSAFLIIIIFCLIQLSITLSIGIAQLRNNWEKYKPKVILIEILGCDLAEIEHNNIAIFLKNKGYMLFAKAVHTIIFTLNEFDCI